MLGSATVRLSRSSSSEQHVVPGSAALPYAHAVPGGGQLIWVGGRDGSYVVPLNSLRGPAVKGQWPGPLRAGLVVFTKLSGIVGTLQELQPD